MNHRQHVAREVRAMTERLERLDVLEEELIRIIARVRPHLERAHAYAHPPSLGSSRDPEPFDVLDEEGGDPAQLFEQTHRAALKTAGIVIEVENERRARPLSTNVWRALERCGTRHRERARQTQRWVEIRRRLVPGMRNTGLVTYGDVLEHASQTLEYLIEVRESLYCVEEFAAA